MQTKCTETGLRYVRKMFFAKDLKENNAKFTANPGTFERLLATELEEGTMSLLPSLSCSAGLKEIHSQHSITSIFIPTLNCLYY